MKYLRHLSLVVLIFSISCAQQPELDNEEGFQSRASVFNGNWRKSCSPFSSDPNSGAGQELLQITNNNFTADYKSYSQRDCSGTSDFTMQYAGTYLNQSTEASSQSNESGSIDMNIQHYYAIPTSEILVAYFNQSAYCGFTDWVISQPREITNRECDGYTYSPMIMYSIYAVVEETPSGFTLQLGLGSEDANGSAPEKRHKELSREVYRKIN